MALFGLMPSKPKPTTQPVVPMPDPQSPEARAAKLREMEMATSRSGRASTMLSGNYSSSTLGTR